MEFLQPRSLAEAIEAKAEHPAAVPIAGGTDVMVEINFDARRPAALLDLNRVGELSSWQRTDGQVRLGATVEATSARGPRLIPAAEFFTGPKRNALAADELITAVLIPAAPGPQQFAKIGTRNAMVIAVCAFALELRPPRATTGAAPRATTADNPVSDYPVAMGSVGTGVGSAGPTPLRARAAEEFLSGVLGEAGLWQSAGRLPDRVAQRFGELVAAAARPIDDVRGTAAYRRHALSVLALLTLAWAWDSYRAEGGAPGCG